MAAFVKVAVKSEVVPGAAKKIELGGKEIAIFNDGGNFCAIDEMCPHRGGPLSEGVFGDKVVTCPWHGWEFDVTTGVSLSNPNAQVSCYPVKIKGEDVLVSA